MRREYWLWMVVWLGFGKDGRGAGNLEAFSQVFYYGKADSSERTGQGLDVPFHAFSHGGRWRPWLVRLPQGCKRGSSSACEVTWWFGLLHACVHSVMAQERLGKQQHLLAVWADLEISHGHWWEQGRNNSSFPLLPQLTTAPCTGCVSRCNTVYKMVISKTFRSNHSVLTHEGLTHWFDVFPVMFSA